MKIKQNGIDITDYVTSITWSGSAEQVSRTLSYNVAHNPTDSKFKSPTAVLGDIITFYANKRLYVGIVTGREKKSEIGEIAIDSKDFLHYLIRDKITATFKNTTAETITKRACNKVGIKTKNLAKTKIHIKKMLAEGENVYNVIVKAYNKASKKNKKYYMPVMSGTSLSVNEKWKSSGVNLYLNIEEASYSENSDSMVNQVAIYSEKGKRLGVVKDTSSINRYGKYTEVYTKEKGVNSRTAAKKLFEGITKEASVKAIGDVRAIAGKSIKITDKSTGLTGTYYITSDSHTWENGIHTMELNIEFKKTRESV